MTAIITAVVATAAMATPAGAQQSPLDRLPPQRFDVVPPSARVQGGPGAMTIRQSPCRTLPTTDVRRRIVDVAAQEWGFFGFTIVDQTRIETTELAPRPGERRRWRLNPAEAARVADSIAGYWTATPEGDWILREQNRAWSGPDGIGARWRYPWSAAFVSWVMCEGGLGSASQFQRAVAHHVYIDQAIRAASAGSPSAAFTAHDIGEAPIVPGDLLCSARRPAYRSIADRRHQMGDGARTHCDIVVKLDTLRRRILAIGGNVRGAVSLKLLPAAASAEVLRPTSGERRLFAHLKLRAAPIENDALDRTPTMLQVGCARAPEPSAPRAAALAAVSTAVRSC